jgi:DNA-directed RNA polymerase subunit beta
LTAKVAAPRARTSFSRIKEVLELPNLIDIQKASFDWFLNEGLRETIDDISPIEDYTGTLAVEFGEYRFGEPQFSIKECREKDLTYQAPLSMTVRFVNKETGEIREQTVFMGDFPMMTEFGTFIINGTERVIVTQLVRSPGAYLMEPKDPTKQVFTANAARGSSWRSTRRASSTPASTASGSSRSRRSSVPSPPRTRRPASSST